MCQSNKNGSYFPPSDDKTIAAMLNTRQCIEYIKGDISFNAVGMYCDINQLPKWQQKRGIEKGLHKKPAADIRARLRAKLDSRADK